MTTTREAADALADAVGDLLTRPWGCSSDDEVGDAVVALERQASRLEAARLRLLAEADARRVGAASGATSTAEWFASATGGRRERAGERVALAGALDGPLAATGAALAEGALTVDHAAVVHRTTSRLDRRLDAGTRRTGRRRPCRRHPGCRCWMRWSPGGATVPPDDLFPPITRLQSSARCGIDSSMSRPVS